MGFCHYWKHVFSGGHICKWAFCSFPLAGAPKLQVPERVPFFRQLGNGYLPKAHLFKLLVSDVLSFCPQSFGFLQIHKPRSKPPIGGSILGFGCSSPTRIGTPFGWIEPLPKHRREKDEEEEEKTEAKLPAL